MKIFVTGGTGFIGSHFLRHALAAGHEIIAIRRQGSTTAIPLEQEPQWITGDLSMITDDILTGCEALVHLAAYGVQFPTEAAWEDCLKWNVIMFTQLMERAVAAGIEKFIICGSCFEYGFSAKRYDFIPPDAPLEPTGPYHASKAAATAIALAFAHQHLLQLAILRPFHVFGEGESAQRIWPLLKAKALAGEDLPMTKGEQIRDFIPVQDVVALLLEHAINSPCKGKPLIQNIGSGIPQTLRSFAETWWSHWNAKGNLLFGELDYRTNEVMRYVPALK